MCARARLCRGNQRVQRVLTVNLLRAGLAEYRNGGLLVDLGVLEPKRADILTELHPPHSEVGAPAHAAFSSALVPL